MREQEEEEGAAAAVVDDDGGRSRVDKASSHKDRRRSMVRRPVMTRRSGWTSLSGGAAIARLVVGVGVGVGVGGVRQVKWASQLC